jgi:hypothetical protein
MVEGLFGDINGGSAGVPEGVESPIADLVRAVTPLVLEDLQADTEGAPWLTVCVGL